MSRENICRFCGGDPNSSNHRWFCDGRQGKVEAAEPEPELVVETVTIPRTRETSAQAFYDGIDSGAIPTRRQQVYKGLRDIGVSTGNEIFAQLGLWFDTSNNIRTRLTELRDLGFVREVGERICSITGKMCITWEVVPPEEYIGVAVKLRCPLCNQVVSRELLAKVHA